MPNHTALLDQLSQQYNKEETLALCYTLDIPTKFLLLDGTLNGLHLSLVNYLERHGQIDKLQAHLGPTSQPDDDASLAWIDSFLAVQDEIPTLKWDTGVRPLPKTQKPYTPGTAVTDPLHFFGRHTLQQNIVTHAQKGGHTALVGLRRIGKSSLLNMLRPQLEAPQTLIAHIDLQDASHHTRAGLFQAILYQWQQQIPNAPEFKGEENGRFSQFVHKLHRARYRLLLLLDEFERLTERPHQFNDDFFDSLRALGVNSKLSFITASHKPLHTLIKEEGKLTSNFDNIFVQQDIGLLDEPSARDLLTLPMHQRNVTPPAQDITPLLRLCGHHPFYLQLLASRLWDALTIGTYSLQQITDDFRYDAYPHWARLWQSLTSAQKQGVRSPHASQWHTMQTLQRLGVLNEEKRPFSSGFQRWLQDET